MSGDGFWGNKQFSGYRGNCNCPNLNKNQWHHNRKVWSKQNNEVNMKNPPTESTTKIGLVKLT